MTKLAHAKAEETDISQAADSDFGMDKAYLKKKKEDEIRLQLDEFAKVGQSFKTAKRKF